MNTLRRTIKFELSTAGRPPFLCSAEFSRPVFFSLISPSVAANGLLRTIVTYVTKAAGRLSREKSAKNPLHVAGGSHRAGLADYCLGPLFCFSSPSSEVGVGRELRPGFFKEFTDGAADTKQIQGFVRKGQVREEPKSGHSVVLLRVRRLRFKGRSHLFRPRKPFVSLSAKLEAKTPT